MRNIGTSRLEFVVEISHDDVGGMLLDTMVCWERSVSHLRREIMVTFIEYE